MPAAIGGFLKGLDSFGYPISVNYKGEESYNSVLGGIFSVIVLCFTMIQVVMAVKELYLMEDPELAEYRQPITVTDREDLLPFDFDSYGFVFSFANVNFDFLN